jgi:hypothetical protein
VAIAIHFHPNRMTVKQFEETHRRLVEAGAAAPNGRIHHSCFGTGGDLMVYDIWESMQAFEAFGQVLMPILADIGVDVGQPAVMDVHSLDQPTTAKVS